ncbi:MAG: HAD-IIIA family hydrolase [Calditrichaeota bacterium]|nr:HAD-IIIA family hydrolase [Calditrichota bacterium]
MLLMDVDGVLTNGKVIFTNSGDEIKEFDIQDGMGITLAKKAGLFTGIITGRESKIIARRAEELNYDVIFQGTPEKSAPYKEIKKQFGLSDEHICYIGDDLPDIPILRRAGFAVAVANARDELKSVAHYVTEKKGGNGAIREVIELILKSQGKYESLLKKYFE